MPSNKGLFFLNQKNHWNVPYKKNSKKSFKCAIQKRLSYKRDMLQKRSVPKNFKMCPKKRATKAKENLVKCAQTKKIGKKPSKKYLMCAQTKRKSLKKVFKKSLWICPQKKCQECSKTVPQVCSNRKKESPKKKSHPISPLIFSSDP